MLAALGRAAPARSANVAATPQFAGRRESHQSISRGSRACGLAAWRPAIGRFGGFAGPASSENLSGPGRLARLARLVSAASACRCGAARLAAADAAVTRISKHWWIFSSRAKSFGIVAAVTSSNVELRERGRVETELAEVRREDQQAAGREPRERARISSARGRAARRARRPCASTATTSAGRGRSGRSARAPAAASHSTTSSCSS